MITSIDLRTLPLHLPARAPNYRTLADGESWEGGFNQYEMNSFGFWLLVFASFLRMGRSPVKVWSILVNPAFFFKTHGTAWEEFGAGLLSLGFT